MKVRLFVWIFPLFIYFLFIYFYFYFLLFCLNCYNWCLYFRLSPLSVLISGIVLVRPSVVQPKSQSHVLFHENGRYTRDIVDIFSTLSSRKFKLYKLNGQQMLQLSPGKWSARPNCRRLMLSLRLLNLQVILVNNLGQNERFRIFFHLQGFYNLC